MSEQNEKTDSTKQGREKKFGQKQPLRHSQALVALDGDSLKVNKQVYRVLVNKGAALDLEALRQKYDPYLNQYDFIVGDVSSAHLRLKGFYKDAVRTAIDRKQQTIADYVMEYCNPGSPYFVLELLNPVHHYHASSRNRYRRNPHGKRPDTTFKRYRVHQTNFKKRASVAEKKETRNHHSFVIKKRKGSS